MLAGCGGGDSGAGSGRTGSGDGLRMGILRFRVQHTLQDNSWLPDRCYLSMEEESVITAWLGQAVLHWDRAIPWLAFDQDPLRVHGGLYDTLGAPMAGITTAGMNAPDE